MRNLGPGHRSHATQERAHQDSRQADKETDLELDPDKAAGDETHAVDLGDDIDEAGENRRSDRHRAREIALVAGAEEVRDGVATELAKIGSKQQRDEDVAAGPPGDEGEAFEATVVERAGKADEGCGAHPVRRHGHAIEHRRNAPPRNVVFGHVGGSARHPDARIDGDRREQKNVPDDSLRQAEGFAHGQK